ncbi:MAG: PD-(D/E)XK nuclease family protein [Alphaproteobacteria bacterium]
MIKNYPLSMNVLDEFAKKVLPISIDDLIFVPTMRAKRKLIDYLLFHSEKKTFFLPKILSFDETENDEEVVENVMSQSRRQILMTQLIQKHFQDFSVVKSFNWAEKLLSLLDKITTERISLEEVENLVENNLNDHYKNTLKFLLLLKNHWNLIIEFEKKKEAKSEKIKQLDSFISKLKNKEKGRIFAIGTTGSLPTTRKLLKVISKHKNGTIIFQGIPNYNKSEWEKITETHHAFGFKNTLEELEINFENIEHIGEKNIREKNLETAFLPAGETAFWNDKNIDSTGTFEDLSIITAPNIQIESRAIALAVLEQKSKNKTALIVTSDRDLVEHLHVVFSRFGLVLEDSVQPSLSQTKIGRDFKNYLSFLSEDSSQKLLVFFKNLKNEFDDDSLKNIEFFLRRIQPESVIKDSVSAYFSLPIKEQLKFQEGYEDFEKINFNFLKLEQKEISFSVHLEKLLQNFRSTTKHNNSDFEALFEEVKLAGHDWILSTRDFLNLLPSCIKNLSAKKTFDTTADALVLGAIEARMQTADLVILSGLNENNFPRSTQDDPFFNEAMRTQLGLPSLSRKIGLMELDFAYVFSKKNVLLTRSITSGGSPTQASRFLEKITAFLGKEIPESIFTKLAIQQDKGREIIEKNPASFSPSIDCRPNEFSASSIEMWMRDPYAFYAKYILKLYAIDEFENSQEMLLFGNVIHDALEGVAKINTWSEKEILTSLQKEIQRINISVSQKLFWLKKAEKIAKFLSDYEVNLPAHKKFAEVWGEAILSGKKLKAKADRIQIFNDGNLEIIDYKTGAIPSKKEIISGLAPQLILEMLIAEKGGFENIEGVVSAITYLRLGVGKKPTDNGQEFSIIDDLQEAKNNALKRLMELFLSSEKENYSYVANRENSKNKYGEYLHLERNEN